MNISKVSPEFATDLIKLVNGCRGLTYNAKVDYVSRKTGQRTKFEYVTLDKIYSHIKQDNNFSILEPLGTNENGEPALQIVLIHKSGEVITSDYYTLRVPKDSSKQDEGSAITYTKRYAIGSFLGICTDEDNDANPDGDGMPVRENTENANNKNKEPKTNVDYRTMLAIELKRRGINVNTFSQENNLTKDTSQEKFKELYDSILTRKG